MLGGLARKVLPSDIHWQLRMAKKSLLDRLGLGKRVLTVETTSSCHVRCVWCLMQTFNKIERRHMPLKSFEAFLERDGAYIRKHYTELAPYLRGEPLLHPEFWGFCEAMARHGLGFGWINTTLSLPIDPGLFKRYPLKVCVNIGGTTKEVHESVMLRSDFDLVCSNLRALWGLGLPIRLKMNPTRRNVGQLAGLPDFVASLGGDPSFVEDYTTYCPAPERASAEELKFFFDQVVSEEVKPYLRFTGTDPAALKQGSRFCNHLTDTIYNNGDMGICCHDDLAQIKVANVFEQSLAEIHKSQRYKKSLCQGVKRAFPACRHCA